MPREVPSAPSLPPLAPAAPGLSPAAEADDVDPELFALPDPPRGRRRLSLVILGIAAFAALAMVVALRHDVAYALVRADPIDLGELRDPGAPGAATAATLAASENRPVRAQAMLGVAGAIQYERLLGGDSFRVLPVAGRRDVWVEVRVPEGQGGRWEPPRSLSGRLVRLDAAGPRHRGLPEAIERATGERPPDRAWLLVDGEKPAQSRWVLVLAATFLGFALWHGATVARLLRRAR